MTTLNYWKRKPNDFNLTTIKELKRFPKLVKIGKDAKAWERIIKILLSRPRPKKHQQKQSRLTKVIVGEKVKTIISNIRFRKSHLS